MPNKKRAISKMVLLIFSFTFFLWGCSGSFVEKEPTDPELPENKGPVYQTIPVPYEGFRKVVGWISEEELLVHTGESNHDVLSIFNILTGELELLYDAQAIVLATAISENQEEILLQLVGAGNTDEIRVINLEGEVVQKLEMDTNGYVNVNWNPADPNLIFLSQYQQGNEIMVKQWDMAQSELQSVESASLTPKWYSTNLYLYVDNEGDFLLENGILYMGDIRTGEVMPLREDVSNFYLQDDTFVTFTPSDFSENELMLMVQYPFLVESGFLTVPKVTMNGRLVFPYLTQGSRNSPIYGVVAKERVQLELDTGDFEFSHLDVENRQIESIVDVPDNAPISMAENGKYSLYGWSFEYLIDIEQQELFSLVPLPNS